MSGKLLALVESNTTGTGRHFAQHAVRLGVRPVLITHDPERYPYVREDEVEHVRCDTSDEEAVFDAVDALNRRGRVVGVTSSSDYYIGTAALTARRLGLPGPSPRAVEDCRDKATQRRLLTAAGVPGPRFTVVPGVDDAVAAARETGYPVVVKPVQGSGSLGVRLCADAAEVRAHAAELLGAALNERGLPRSGQVLVEETLTGDEFSVEVFDGRSVAVVAKHLGPHPYFVETGHDVPAALPDDIAHALRRTAENAAAALATTFGAVHVELRAPRTGTDVPRVIEVNPRLAGGMIPELLRRACGVDMVRAQVLAALGRPVVPESTRHAAASIRFVTADAETAVAPGAASALTRVRAEDGVVEAALYRAPGTPVGPPRDFRDRAGHIIAVADTPGRSGAAAEAAVHTLRTALFTGNAAEPTEMEASPR
ncbi:ATP-grasp domain-containing protein [Streptomyces sp. NPDC002431]